MKSKDVISLSLLFVCTAVVAFSLTFYVVSKSIGEKGITRNINSETNSSAVVSKYTIGEFNGRIAVYYGDNILPDEIYDTFLESLPVEDIEKLNIGITVYSKEDAQKLVEDYTS